MKKITSLLAAAAAALSLTFTGISAAAAPAEYADISAQEEVSVINEDNGEQVEVQQLLLAETDTPVEVENTAPEENSNDFVKKLLISLAVGLIIALIVCMIMKSMMKTANPKATANDYIRKNSFNITRSRDIFIYAKVTKKKREKQENK
ncbi:MAG: hypothetical protein ACI4RK_02265 [Oscillospiraceae bacterium]